MTVEIKQIKPNLFLVNEKAVYKNFQGKWSFPAPLNDVEVKVFKRHLNAIKLNIKNRLN